MARLTVSALGIDANEILWRAVGPPPERIEQLISGEVTASLIRVEEAISLSQRYADRLHTLLGFADLKRLVPVQPHGVLTTTEAFEREAPDAIGRLVRGMIRASRALHDDFATFREVFDHHVTVSVPEEAIQTIWQQEHDSGGFAVNGEMSADHWQTQFDQYRRLDPNKRPIAHDEILATRFVAEALTHIGPHPADFDRTAT